MTLQKLSAGSGYEYLTRQVAALDSTEKGSIPLADYYSAKGESPGRWVGSGLTGIDGLELGDVVTAEQMKHLFGSGCDPVSGRPLGAAYKLYANETVDAFNARVDELLADSSKPTSAERAAARTTAAHEFFVADQGREPASGQELSAALKRYSRPRQTAVAGFDLTFSPVKSVSTLWAVAPREIAAKIELAHHAAVADALTFIEQHALFTREGKDGARQVETRGLIAAAFTHRDSRAGDPDLHTHVAVANKVQTKQGKWLSIYGRVLYQHVVAASETYNTALERHLVEVLGVQFGERPRLDREKRPIREIVGVDQALCEAWSSRRTDIVARQRVLTRDFRTAHGRRPTPVESVALAQQANLETREAKHEPCSLAVQRATWRTQADEVLGSAEAVDRMVQSALHRTASPTTSNVSTSWVREMAERVLGELEAHRATWQSWHVHAEVHRQIRGAGIPADRIAEAVGWVIDEVTELSVNLTRDRDPISEPAALCRSDGTSVYRHTGRDHFTTTSVLDAEARIVAAASTDAGAWSTDDVELSVLASRLDGIELNAGQEQLVRDMATSGRRVQLALAPAGAGKTTAMRVLAGVWTEAGGVVLGLAPSAAAAAALGDATGMPCETLAKLIHDHDTRPDSPLAAAVGQGTLLVIDEAGMADTLSLDRVISFAAGRGAAVRLIGDDQQLAAIGAGGVLRDIARTHGAVRLDEVVRFDDPIESEASLALRDGDRKSLGYYLDHERIHVGDQGTVGNAVFDAWQREQSAGRDCLMLAPTHEFVRELNDRARAARLGDAAPDVQVQLRDGTHASVGDVVLTRRNDRRLVVSSTDWVKNGDRWTVTGIRKGHLTVRHRGSGLTTVVPAEYVAAHVELGYASTVHTAQGLTADVMHGVVTGEETRQLLYTMLTRGRAENHVHVITDDLSEDREFELPGITEQLTATEILERVLARDGASVSAMSTRQQAATPETRLQDAATRYADVLAYATHVVLGADDDQAVQSGPLPWLSSIPTEVAEHPRWGPYLSARARLVEDLAGEVRGRADETLPAWLGQYDDVLTTELRSDLAVWRAAQGIAPDERTMAGPAPADDRAAWHQRSLVRIINSRYDEAVHAWEKRIVAYVGRADEHTLDLARELDRLKRRGLDPERLLARAAARPFPSELSTAALSYRIRKLVAPRRRRPEPVGIDQRRQAASRREPGIGI
jgi:conjugative relaxase-like TrwC/TraI family protein